MVAFKKRSGGYKAGVVLLFLMTGIFVAGFCSSYWAVYDIPDSTGRGVTSEFLHEGLWSECYSAEGGNAKSRCEMFKFKAVGDWLHGVRSLETLCLVLQIFAIGYALIVNCCRSEPDDRYRLLEVITGVGSLLGLIGVIVYAAQRKQKDVPADTFSVELGFRMPSRGTAYDYEWGLYLAGIGSGTGIIIAILIAAFNFREDDFGEIDRKSNHSLSHDGSYPRYTPAYPRQAQGYIQRRDDNFDEEGVEEEEVDRHSRHSKSSLRYAEYGNRMRHSRESLDEERGLRRESSRERGLEEDYRRSGRTRENSRSRERLDDDYRRSGGKSRDSSRELRENSRERLDDDYRRNGKSRENLDDDYRRSGRSRENSRDQLDEDYRQSRLDNGRTRERSGENSRDRLDDDHRRDYKRPSDHDYWRDSNDFDSRRDRSRDSDGLRRHDNEYPRPDYAQKRPYDVRNDQPVRRDDGGFTPRKDEAVNRLEDSARQNGNQTRRDDRGVRQDDAKNTASEADTSQSEDGRRRRRRRRSKRNSRDDIDDTHPLQNGEQPRQDEQQTRQDTEPPRQDQNRNKERWRHNDDQERQQTERWHQSEDDSPPEAFSTFRGGYFGPKKKKPESESAL